MTGATRLLVFAHLDGNWTQCGKLTMTERADGHMSSTFEYDGEYLALQNRVELDPVSLPPQQTSLSRSSIQLPINVAPLFGAFRDSTPDAFGRRVIERKLSVALNGLREADYLLHAGPHRVGALDFRLDSGTDAPAHVDDSFDLEELCEAAARIDDGLTVPRELHAIFSQGAGLGGARPKASFRDEHGVLWVSKFPTKTDLFDVASVELATLTLAAKTGVHVPELKTVAVGERNVFLSQRFDRFRAHRYGSTSCPSDREQYLAAQERAIVEPRVFYMSALQRRPAMSLSRVVPPTRTSRLPGLSTVVQSPVLTTPRAFSSGCLSTSL
ncbi:conserved hypothetical protein [Burkholderia sp. 8Y]|nr:conserved hypothetical protein [Burkholderia sp. 8Y]